jgi:hypothetical protein
VECLTLRRIFLRISAAEEKLPYCGSRVTSWELLALYCFRWTCWALVMSVLFRMARSGATPTEQSSAFHACQRTHSSATGFTRTIGRNRAAAATAVLAMPARRDNVYRNLGVTSIHCILFTVSESRSERFLRYLAMFDCRSCVNAMLPWAIASCDACWAISFRLRRAGQNRSIPGHFVVFWQ